MESLEWSTEEKVQAILAGLSENKSRDELAEDLGYKNYRSLDMTMRRQGYCWDAGEGRYYKPSEQRLPASSRLRLTVPAGKPGKIINSFAQGTLDVKEIAVREGFADHREMASYMKAQGYVWCANKNNYARDADEEDEVASAPDGSDVVPVPDRNVQFATGPSGDIQDYLPHLEWLRQNVSTLEAIIGDRTHEGAAVGNIPRYAVPGIFITKSVHMSNQLDQLVRDFSVEKNISQRDIFAVALAEFFRKYGYRKQIETLLEHNG